MGKINNDLMNDISSAVSDLASLCEMVVGLDVDVYSVDLPWSVDDDAEVRTMIGERVAAGAIDYLEDAVYALEEALSSAQEAIDIAKTLDGLLDKAETALNAPLDVEVGDIVGVGGDRLRVLGVFDRSLSDEKYVCAVDLDDAIARPAGGFTLLAAPVIFKSEDIEGVL